MVLCTTICQAQITQVNSMQEIFKYFDDANSKTLAIFDIDMVLTQPSDPAFQMANMKRYKTTAKRIMNEIPEDKRTLFQVLMTINSKPILIDENTPLLVQQLIAKKIPTMALTSNLTGELKAIQSMEQWKSNNLKQLGMDFSKTAPLKQTIIFKDLPPYRGNFTTYHDGILFVNGLDTPKGDAFLAFLDKTPLCFDKIIFIDDREENLHSLESAIQKLGKPIAYQGLHYTGALNYPSIPITEEEFEARWQQLASEVITLN